MKKLLLLSSIILLASCSKDSMDAPAPQNAAEPTATTSSISSKGVERPSTYTIKIAGGTYEISELIEYDRTTENDTNIFYHFNHVNDGNIQYQINYNKSTKLYYTYITIDKWNNGVIGVSRNLQAAISVMAGN